MKLSIGDVLLSGPRVIRREPKVFLIWSAVYLVALLLSVAANGWQFAVMIGDLQAIGQRLLGQHPDLDALRAANKQTGSIWSLAVLPAMLIQLFGLAAIYRAVLSPDDRRWAYFRFSRQELWLFLSALALVGVMFAGGLLVILLLVVTGYSIGHMLGGIGGVLIGLLLMVTGYGVCIWALCRFAPGIPMSFLEARFSLFRGFRLSHGQAWRIFLCSLVAMLGVLFVELVVITLLVGGTILAWPGGLSALANEPTSAVVQQLTRVGAILLLPGAVLGAALHVWLCATPAEVYRQLRAPAAP